MNYRINRKIVALVGLLVLAAIGLFAYTLVSAPTAVPESEQGSFVQQSQATEQLITARHQYRGGIHTLAGRVDLPTECHKVVVEPFFTTPNTAVELRFSTALEREGCPSVATSTPFKVTFEAPESVSIGATWDGAPARLNLVPVPADRSIDDEEYVKG